MAKDRTKAALTLATLTRPMTIARAARLVRDAGADPGGAGTVTAATIRAHIGRGAPLRRDGKIVLAEYLAWLIREAGRG